MLRVLKGKCKTLGPTTHLQPHFVPKWKWDIMLMEFIVSLLLTPLRYDAIMDIMDSLIKLAHFTPI